MCVDEAGPHQVPGLSNARSEDSSGRVWFLWQPRVIVVRPSGQREELNVDALHEESSMVWDKPTSLWMTTTHGLAHFAMEEAGGKVTLKQVAEYARGLPRGSTKGLWLDEQGSLWTIEPSQDGQKLWRIEIK